MTSTTTGDTAATATTAASAPAQPAIDFEPTPLRPGARAHHRFWPKRLPYAIAVPATSLWDNLANSARRYPDKPALVFFGRVLSYRQVLSQAERLAGHLYAMGVRRGDRVLLNLQNSPQLVIAHFAILRANAVVVPVNPMNRA
ncbi:MAG: long-chain fatty acid--CoA ligase, partial [Rhodoferax sp.]|nr:long-chain fatty acid--CoA ligase [Rhodoferax sp.]